MTIASAITALSPALYWKLDDGTGPAASDSSGNGRPGVYSGQFQLGNDGPEAGTYSCLFQGGGIVQAAGGAWANQAVVSFMCWVAMAAAPPAYSSVFGSSTTLGGGTICTQASGATLGQLAFTRNNVGNTVLAQWYPDARWHHHALCSDGTSTIYYLDGVNVGSVGAGMATPTNPSIRVTGPAMFLAAHFALFPGTKLSAANVASVASAPASLQVPYFVTGTATYGAVMTQLLLDDAKLDQILRDVERTY